MSRRKKAPQRGRERFDLSGVRFSMCGLAGYSIDCAGPVMPYVMIEQRGLKVLPEQLVVGLCHRHRVQMAVAPVIAEHVGCRAPRWVWAKATDPAQRSHIIETMKVLRSTARSVGDGPLREDQWPFWMENERIAWLKEKERRALIDRHNEQSDLRMQMTVAAARAGVEPGTPLELVSVVEDSNGKVITAKTPDGLVLTGHLPWDFTHAHIGNVTVNPEYDGDVLKGLTVSGEITPDG